MPRGKHTKTGYPWGISDKERTHINIPKAIVPEVREYAQELWEKRKEESNQPSSSKDTVGEESELEDLNL